MYYRPLYMGVSSIFGEMCKKNNMTGKKRRFNMSILTKMVLCGIIIGIRELSMSLSKGSTIFQTNPYYHFRDNPKVKKNPYFKGSSAMFRERVASEKRSSAQVKLPEYAAYPTTPETLAVYVELNEIAEEVERCRSQIR